MPSVELAIIGGGAAGLTAGLYASRLRLDVVMIERMGTGGQIINAATIDNFPGFPGGIKGYELGPLMAQQALDAGLRIEYQEVQRISRQGEGFLLETDGAPVTARAVLLASGSSLTRLDVPGESEFEGRGVSYCATCDGEFFRDQPVAVVGGGDTAMDEALYLADIAASVSVLVRGSALRAQPVLVERVRAQPAVSIRLGTSVLAITGDAAVEAVTITSGGMTEQLPVSGVFVSAGLTPNTALLRGLLALDSGGYVPVDLWMRTVVPGLLAAGDLRQDSARQLVSSAGDGATAALAAARYLRGGEWR